MGAREIHPWLIDMDGVLVREEHAIPGADRFPTSLIVDPIADLVDERD